MWLLRRASKSVESTGDPALDVDDGSDYLEERPSLAGALVD
jgi:hypothetical protein